MEQAWNEDKKPDVRYRSILSPEQRKSCHVIPDGRHKELNLLGLKISFNVM
jgi:hypothetical protein